MGNGKTIPGSASSHDLRNRAAADYPIYRGTPLPHDNPLFDGSRIG